MRSLHRQVRNRGKDILIVAPFDAIAGAQRVIVTLNRALGELGWRTKILLGFGNSGLVSSLDEVRRFSSSESVFARKLLYPLWLAYTNIIVVSCAFKGIPVWGNTVYSAPALILGAFVSPSRLILQVHELDFPAPFLWTTKWLSKRGVTVLCVSQFQSDRLGVKSQVLLNSVSCRPRINNNRSRFLFVGRPSKSKGFDLFIDVAHRLKGTKLAFYAFITPGSGSENLLIGRARDLGINVVVGESSPEDCYVDGFLTFIGTDPNLWTETFSLVCAESIACGVPVVSAGAGVISETAGSCLAFDEPSRNPEAIAAGVRLLLNQSDRYESLLDACSERHHAFSDAIYRNRLQELLCRMGSPSN